MTPAESPDHLDSGYLCPMNLESLCTKTCGIVRETGSFIQREAAVFTMNAVESKSFNQLVSYVDTTAESMLVKGLNAILPEAGFITEEQTIITETKEWMWVIDPLDGTTNFVHGVPVYSISVGLLHQQKPVLGVVMELNRDELFYAWEGSKAYMNGKEIHVAENTDFSKSLLATGFPYYDFTIMEKYLSALHILMKNTHGMRRMGSAAVDLVYVACGRFDGFFEFGLAPWDVAGGSFIVQQAGGIVTGFNGEQDNFLFGRSIIASSTGIYNDFQEIIAKEFLQ